MDSEGNALDPHSCNTTRCGMLIKKEGQYVDVYEPVACFSGLATRPSLTSAFVEEAR